jgi:hypothetical protein
MSTIYKDYIGFVIKIWPLATLPHYPIRPDYATRLLRETGYDLIKVGPLTFDKHDAIVSGRARVGDCPSRKFLS